MSFFFAMVRKRYYPVAAQISSMLARFTAMGDLAILESHFRVADAQKFVARQEGFDGWQALISGGSVR